MSNSILAAAGPAQHLAAPRRSTGQSAVVVNAAKFSGAALTKFRDTVDASFAGRGLVAPLWLPTSPTRREPSKRAKRVRVRVHA